ncbi:MAG: hypothetical protein CMA10_07095 [Euryarchaeota archaeon]|nr:hypothetical protein [Euryarchaeota archaeon]|tara:strand:- start:5145 stop:7181 length:2037 start_codon:yes stop_codon:yes gene_type:complete
MGNTSGEFKHDPLEDGSTEGEGESTLLLLVLCYGSTFEYLLSYFMKNYRVSTTLNMIPQLLLMGSLLTLIFMILTLIDNSLILIGFAWIFKVWSVSAFAETDLVEIDTTYTDQGGKEKSEEEIDKKAQVEWTEPLDAWNPGEDWREGFVKICTLGLADKNDFVGSIFYRIAGFDWPKIFQGVCVFALLWVFLLSLSLMGTAFKILGGKDSAKMFDVVDNPISGLMVGILVTVLVQSSSTSTSIIISLVGANELSVNNGIAMIMGANIGTSVTNTIVALGHYDSAHHLRRGFAAATVHDVFNILSVLIILPFQWSTNFLAQMTYQLSKDADPCKKSATNSCEAQDFLKPYISPYSKGVASYDKSVAKNVAMNFCSGKCNSIGDLNPVEITNLFCKKIDGVYDCSKIPNIQDSWLEDTDKHLIKARTPAFVFIGSQGNEYLLSCSNCSETTLYNPGNYSIGGTYKVCADFSTGLCDKDLLKGGLFKGWGYTDNEAGAMLVIISLSGICSCLFLIISILRTLMRGPLTCLLRKAIDINGYLSIMIGMVITLMVQSSSITTSALTPLAAVGIINLDQMYPLTLGANLGTTVTGIWAASVAVSNPVDAWTVALAHLFFNIFGCILWYPIPKMREIPIYLANQLGNYTTKFKLFPIFYVGTVFFAIPAFSYGMASAASNGKAAD